MIPVTIEAGLGILLAICTGFGTYAAIRADLARLHERTSMALEGVKAAHERIDQHFDQRRKA